MDIDPDLARSLGFPTPAYASVERERRWLCHAVPGQCDLRTERITDLYVDGARLRLREARPLSGAPAILRLSRKGDVDERTRLVTSIYLEQAEFALLAASLPGRRVRKLRHRLPPEDGVTLMVDEFEDELAGLLLVEAEFKSDAAMAAFVPPPFAGREITGDVRYTGAMLAREGRPAAIG
jgi:CYTH domain-containing protein